jgi:hypothetical protein
VKGANSYLVRYKVDGEWFEEEVKGAAFDLPSGVKQSEVDEIEVRVMGNGSTKIGSLAGTWIR